MRDDSFRSEAIPSIDLWYGTHQVFGVPAFTQRFVNILGTVTGDRPISKTCCALNGSSLGSFLLGPDLHRLARPGDFNLEFPAQLLRAGTNRCEIHVVDVDGKEADAQIEIEAVIGGRCPLPYEISWDSVGDLQTAVQVLDGRWALGATGIRTVDPYYDRSVSFGDGSWSNYEAHVEVTFHGFTPSSAGPPTYDVTHAAVASRWPGFDTDEYRPHRKWYPLGATCEFRLSSTLESCAFRILGGAEVKVETPRRKHHIELERKYVFKTRVESVGGGAWYRAAIWDAEEDEPATWDIELEKAVEEVSTGGALAIAHHSDVTFGRILVIPV